MYLKVIMSNIQLPIEFYSDFLTKEEADNYYKKLIEELDFKSEKVFLNGQWYTPNRSIDFRSDENISYTYSGVKKEGNPWTPSLIELKSLIEKKLDIVMNACLCNFYPDGTSAMGWHTDAESDLEKNPIIVSISLGAGRDFQIRKINRTENDKNHTIHLNHGSLVVMKRGMQSSWEHCVPKRMKVIEPRINLTFRIMIPKNKNSSFTSYLKKNTN
jgi:alkylated DNA repair dioxygenase AlkB